MIVHFYEGLLHGNDSSFAVLITEEKTRVYPFLTGWFSSEETRRAIAEQIANNPKAYSTVECKSCLLRGFLGAVNTEEVYKIPSEASWKVTFDPKEEELKELREENKNLKATVDALQRQVTFLRDDNVHLEESNVKLQSKVSEWKTDYDRVVSNLQNTIRHNNELQKELAKTRQTIQHVRVVVRDKPNKLSELFSG